jgi:O-antigen/teichoic acid export membrane protein
MSGERLALRAARNSTWAVVGSVINAAQGFVVFYAVIDKLHVGGEDVRSMVLNHVTFFGLFTTFGLSGILIRDMARFPEKAAKIIGNGIYISLGLCALAFSISWTASFFTSPDPEKQALMQLMSLSLLFGSSATISCVFRAKLRMDLSIILDIARNLVFLIGALLLFYHYEFGIRELFIFMIVFDFASLLAMYKVGSLVIKPDFAFDYTLCRNLLRDALPLGMASLAIFAYYKLDRFMLENMVPGENAVGLYSTAARFPEATNRIPSALMASFYPILSMFAYNDMARFRTVLAAGLRLMLVLALPLGLIGLLYSASILRIFPDEGVLAATPSMRLLMIGQICFFINLMLFQSLNALQLQGLNMRITIVMLVVNVVLNFMLIPHYSHVGASAATLATEFVGLMLESYVIYRILRFGFPSRDFWRLLMCIGWLAICMGVARHYWHADGFWVLLELSAVGALYFGVVLWSKAIDLSQWQGWMRTAPPEPTIEEEPPYAPSD